MSPPVSAMTICAKRALMPGMPSRRATASANGAISTSIHAVSSAMVAAAASIRCSIAVQRKA